jgi:hypothetical protein
LIGAAEPCSTAGARMGCSADPLAKLVIEASSGELPLFIAGLSGEIRGKRK